jgi:hypothetical protein
VDEVIAEFNAVPSLSEGAAPVKAKTDTEEERPVPVKEEAAPGAMEEDDGWTTVAKPSGKKKNKGKKFE